MTLNETIEEKLKDKFPGKTFKLIPEADPITFETFVRLSVNSKRTDFGFYPEQWSKKRALEGADLIELATQFVDTVRGIAIL